MPQIFKANRPDRASRSEKGKSVNSTCERRPVKLRLNAQNAAQKGRIKMDYAIWLGILAQTQMKNIAYTPRNMT